MTLLLARQPGERAFRRRGPVQAPGGTDGGPEEQAGWPSGPWGGHPHVLRGHQGRQRPQVGWRAATAVALAGVSTGGAAGPVALGALAGAAGAGGGRWKW